MRRRKGLFIVFFSVLFFFLVTRVHSEARFVDTFSSYVEGSFPSWKTYPLHKAKAKKVYFIKSEQGNKYLSASDVENISTPIFKEFEWDLARYPYVQFRWRALKLPPGARETSKATNDSACGVYVGFGGKLSGVALKYVWSTLAPLENVWEKDKNRFFIIVKQSGSQGLGHWQFVKINVAEEFKKHFKKTELKNPFGIGVLTDANAVSAVAACDYDDFKISSH